MKKLISIIIFSVALLTVSPIAVLAYPDELTDSIAEELADTSYGDFINEEEASGDVSIDIVSKTVDIIRDCFDGAVGNFGKVFATLAGIVALCALLGPLAAGNTPLRTVFDFVAVIVISMPLYSAAAVRSRDCAEVAVCV